MTAMNHEGLGEDPRDLAAVLAKGDAAILAESYIRQDGGERQPDLDGQRRAEAAECVERRRRVAARHRHLPRESC